MTVTISGFDLENINASWDNLVHLDLSYTSLDGVMKVIRDAPLLETCSLLFILPPADGFPTTPGTIIRHPQIRMLEASSMDTSSGIVTALLDWLELPSLESCHICSHSSDRDSLRLDTVISLIKRSGCSLKTLKVWSNALVYSTESEDMERLLRTVPHLRYRFTIFGLSCYQ